MKYIVKLVILTVLVSCTKDQKKQSNVKVESNKIIKNNDKLNISFLLDLSDRINPSKYPNESMAYYKRDVSYINSVLGVFDKHIRTKKLIRVNDKIQLYFDPEPKNSTINNISNQLKYHLTKDNLDKNLLTEIKKKYSKLPEKIYDLAIKDNKYVGSDTWGFFKNKVKDYCIEDDYRNVLIILTDGYIYYEKTLINEGNMSTYLTPKRVRKNKLTKSNWANLITEEQYGFLPININLSNLEILVLGIKPDSNNPYEEDVIKTYWSNWLKKMKVKRFEIRTTDLPSNMDKIIKTFINTNN